MTLKNSKKANCVFWIFKSHLNFKNLIFILFPQLDDDFINFV